MLLMLLLAALWLPSAFAKATADVAVCQMAALL